MSVRIIVLPDPIHAKGVTECKVLGTISDEEYKLLKEKLRWFTPDEKIHGTVHQEGIIDVNAPIEEHPASEYIYAIRVIQGKPYFWISKESLGELKEKSPEEGKHEVTIKAPVFFELINSYMEQTGHKSIQIGIDPEPDERKEYSVEGELDVDEVSGCYFIYLYEMDKFTEDDFLGWRWITPESHKFKITYSASDFMYDEDLLAPNPELKIKVFEWTGSGYRTLGHCKKTKYVKKHEKVNIKIDKDGYISAKEDGWECEIC